MQQSVTTNKCMSDHKHEINVVVIDNSRDNGDDWPITNGAVMLVTNMPFASLSQTHLVGDGDAKRILGLISALLWHAAVQCPVHYIFEYPDMWVLSFAERDIL